MGENQHDKYGKQVMRKAAGLYYSDSGMSIEVNYKAGRPARIDGTIDPRVAVEIDSRTSKQVRGAVLDLICHKNPKKLPVLIPRHMNDVNTTAEQCRYILGRFVDEGDFRVVVLRGDGDAPQLENDAGIIKTALAKLGIDTSVV